MKGNLDQEEDCNLILHCIVSRISLTWLKNAGCYHFGQSTWIFGAKCTDKYFINAHFVKGVSDSGILAFNKIPLKDDPDYFLIFSKKWPSFQVEN